MTRSLANKRFLVFGGSGAIGKVVVEALLDAGSFVDVAAHNHRRAHQKLDEVKKRCQRDMLYITRGVNVCDYRTLGDMWSADYATPDAEDYYHYLDGIVYAVGNCPSGGFDEAVSLPLTDLDQETFEEEFNRQVVGLQNVSRFFGNLELDSAVLVIGSAITRLTDEQCPSWLHAGQYAVAKAAQAELIKWLRRDPIVREEDSNPSSSSSSRGHAFSPRLPASAAGHVVN